MLSVKQGSCEYQFSSHWFDPTRNQTPVYSSRDRRSLPLGRLSCLVIAKHLIHGRKNEGWVGASCMALLSRLAIYKWLTGDLIRSLRFALLFPRHHCKVFSELCPGTKLRRYYPSTGHTLQCNSASIMKIWCCCAAWMRKLSFWRTCLECRGGMEVMTIEMCCFTTRRRMQCGPCMRTVGATLFPRRKGEWSPNPNSFDNITPWKRNLEEHDVVGASSFLRDDLIVASQSRVIFKWLGEEDISDFIYFWSPNQEGVFFCVLPFKWTGLM